MFNLLLQFTKSLIFTFYCISSSENNLFTPPIVAIFIIKLEFQRNTFSQKVISFLLKLPLLSHLKEGNTALPLALVSSLVKNTITIDLSG